MAEMISAAVQRDIEDIGKSINTDAIITPRVGEPFESIPMVSRTALPRITNLEQEKANKVEVADALSEKVNTDEVYLKSQAYSIDEVDQVVQASELNLQTQIAAVGVGNKAYKTYALMDADKANIAAKSKVTVTNDATSSNNGDWQWDGAVFTKSVYDPLTQAKADATTKANAAETNAKEYVEAKTGNITSQILESNEDPFSIEDSNNKIAFAVREDGTTEVAKLNAKEFTAAVVNSNLDTGSAEVSDAFSEELEVIDSNNKIAFAVRNDGTTEVAKLDAKELFINNKPLDANLNITKLGIFCYNIAHVECLGQSLSLGTNGSPILTTTQKTDNLMFVGGIRKQHPNDTSVEFFSSLVPLIESLSEDNGVPYIYGETPVGGATEQIKDLIKSENKVDYTEQNYQLLGTASGEGGKRIHELRDTYVPTNLLPAITAAYNLAQDQGKTYGMSAITFVHGEADNANPTTQDQYKSITLEILSNIDAHVKATNGQTEDVKLITSQLASFGSATTWPKIELALYQLAMENPNKVFMACPLYIFDYTDSYHLNNVGSKWLGAYLGLTYKRVVIDGEDWKPVHPISHVKQGRVLEVKFHVPVQPLVFDTDQVAKNTDTYGFSLVDNAGTAIAIESVIVTQPDTVKFVTAAPIPVGSKLRYAWTPVAQPNRTTGPRGNLRDSQGDSIVFDESGINKRMDNWCPIFEYAL